MRYSGDGEAAADLLPGGASVRPAALDELLHPRGDLPLAARPAAGAHGRAGAAPRGRALRRHAHEDGIPDPLPLVAPGRAQAELHTRWVARKLKRGKSPIAWAVFDQISDIVLTKFNFISQLSGEKIQKYGQNGHFFGEFSRIFAFRPKKHPLSAEIEIKVTLRSCTAHWGIVSPFRVVMRA